MCWTEPEIETLRIEINDNGSESALLPQGVDEGFVTEKCLCAFRIEWNKAHEISSVLFNDSVFVGLSEAVILYLIVFKNKEFEEEPISNQRNFL